jgi:hypothetical protein
MNELWTPRLGRYLARHPSNVVLLVRAGWRLRRRGWLRHAPFLPFPDPAYWHFRMVTVNGSTQRALTPKSMVDAAKWALRQPVGHRS